MSDDTMTDEPMHHATGEQTAHSGAADGDATPYIELVQSIVTKVVSDPSAVEVSAQRQGRTTIVEVAVAPDDMGKVIGKGGRNIDAIRSVTRAAGLRQHERVQVELLEDEDDDGDDAEGVDD